MIPMKAFTYEFVDEWEGKTLNVNGAWINFDSRYGTQCMDLWNYWWTELEISAEGFPRHYDAAGVWEDFNGKHYEYFDGILPTEPALPGDVFIYNRWAFGNNGGGPGHIGIVIADLGDSIQVLETNGLGDGYEDDYMNQYGSPARVHTWPKANLYGYLRFIQEDSMNADQAKQLNEIHARVFGRDVQRWMHPNSGEVSFDNKPGWIPCRSTDIHDILSTNNLVTSQTNKVLDVVSKIPGVDPKLISELRTQLSEELKLATSNLTITLKTD